MTDERLKEQVPAEFKRFTGVPRVAFEKMLEAFGEQDRRKKSGRPPKLAW